jgi:Mlc titration factor MtfA (ptsG expression regulator)|tara:strand:- start:101 stop:1018 length:918 start_codon:yes stop_codon:yes gene_type:complete
MNFKSPSTRLIIPLVILMIVGYMVNSIILSFVFFGGGFLGIALVYVFRQPIHWYWYCKNPPPIAPQMITILERKVPYYQNLSLDNKRHFLKRMSLFLMAKEMESINEDQDFPADFKGLLTASAVQVNFGQERFLFPEFHKVLVHPGLFLSAVINKQFHGSETFIDPDFKGHSCQIFAGDRLLHAFNEPKSGYNIAIHEMANAFASNHDISKVEGEMKSNPKLLEYFAIIRGFNYHQAIEYTKNPSLSHFGLAVEHFYYNPKAFEVVLPKLFELLCETLNQNPLNAESPVIESIDYELLLERKDIY